MLKKIDNEKLFKEALKVLYKNEIITGDDYAKIEFDGELDKELCAHITKIRIDNKNLKGLDNFENLEEFQFEYYKDGEAGQTTTITMVGNEYIKQVENIVENCSDDYKRIDYEDLLTPAQKQEFENSCNDPRLNLLSNQINNILGANMINPMFMVSPFNLIAGAMIPPYAAAMLLTNNAQLFSQLSQFNVIIPNTTNSGYLTVGDIMQNVETMGLEAFFSLNPAFTTPTSDVVLQNNINPQMQEEEELILLPPRNNRGEIV